MRHLISTRILRAFCRDPDASDTTPSVYDEHPLTTLRREFPGFDLLVRGRRVLDFGCGDGLQAAALATELGCDVVGFDPDDLAIAAARSRTAGVSNIRFTTRLSQVEGQFDIVLSQDGMEHYPDPEAVFRDMLDRTAHDGALLITFGPPWYAPYGSHMYFFTRIPWVHLLFSEETVMNVRRNYRDDGATRYTEVRSGLNQMTVERFEALLRNAGVQVEWDVRRTARRIPVSDVPVLRELLVNRCTVLVRPGRAAEKPRRTSLAS